MCNEELYSQSVFVTIHFCSEWINEYLCRFDCAVTERKFRSDFLTNLTYCIVTNDVLRNECYFSKFEWIALRQMDVRNVDFNIHKMQSLDVPVLSRSRKLENVNGGVNKQLLRLIGLCPVIKSLSSIGKRNCGSC